MSLHSALTPPPDNSSAKLRREADFHDKIFGEGGREQAGKFYSIAEASKRFYRTYLADHSAGKLVLEYGSGPYTHSVMMMRQGARVIGIDISPVAVQQYRSWARSKGQPNAMACVMNAEQLAFAPASFDLICGTGILHHLDLERSYAEIARALKPGGCALFLEPLGHNPLINLYRRLSPTMRTPDEHPLLQRDLQLARRHFQRVDLTYYHLLSLAAVPFRGWPGFKWLVGALDRTDQLLFRWLPWLRRHAWVVCLMLSEPAAASRQPAGR